MTTDNSPPSAKFQRKPSVPRKARVIDPAVLSIRKEASERIKAYHQASASPKVLDRMLKQIEDGKLTETDLLILRKRLNDILANQKPEA